MPFFVAPLRVVLLQLLASICQIFQVPPLPINDMEKKYTSGLSNQVVSSSDIPQASATGLQKTETTIVNADYSFNCSPASWSVCWHAILWKPYVLRFPRGSQVLGMLRSKQYWMPLINRAASVWYFNLTAFIAYRKFNKLIRFEEKENTTISFLYLQK